MTREDKLTYDGVWDCLYPLIELTDTNRPILLNDERFWGKR